MNILCVEQFSHLGGGQRSLIDLLPGFSERGWQTAIAVPGDGPFPEELRRLGYGTDDLGCSPYTSISKPLNQILQYARELPRLAREINSIVSDRKIDLIYVNGPRFLPPAAWVARRRNLPIVFHCHSRLLQKSAIVLAGMSLRFARANVIACCLQAFEPLRMYVKSERVRVLYNGVQAVGEAPVCLPASLRRVGVVGRIEVEKGQLDFVRAVRLIAPQLPDCQFTITGAPLFSSREYYDQVVAASSGLPIAFPGWQSDASQIFSNLDLLVVPSTPVEATTRVIVEAYSAGVPVVAFPSGGIPEILTDKETGFLAADSTVEALAARIMSVLQLPSSEIQTVVARARRAWQDNFSLGIFRERVCEVITQTALSVSAQSFQSLHSNKKWVAEK
jgi:glycosyltransferase involved in cell wall biosynthesis